MCAHNHGIFRIGTKSGDDISVRSSFHVIHLILHCSASFLELRSNVRRSTIQVFCVNPVAWNKVFSQLSCKRFQTFWIDRRRLFDPQVRGNPRLCHDQDSGCCEDRETYSSHGNTNPDRFFPCFHRFSCLECLNAKYARVRPTEIPNRTRRTRFAQRRNSSREWLRKTPQARPHDAQTLRAATSSHDAACTRTPNQNFGGTMPT